MPTSNTSEVDRLFEDQAFREQFLEELRALRVGAEHPYYDDGPTDEELLAEYFAARRQR
jgi:hypothetical protein